MEINNEKKLGRGLSALLGESSRINNSIKINDGSDAVQMISVDKIIAGMYQPRKSFDQHQLAELSNSIQQNGIIQPIIVRKIDGQNNFEIIAGERRFRAAKMAGMSLVPVIIKNINNAQTLEFSIIENVQRADLSPMEEAHGYKQLINEFDYTQEEVAKKIGCSRSHIANILRLLSLPKEVQDLLAKEKITLGHAKAIMNSKDIAQIAQQIVKNAWTVRDVEAVMKNEALKVNNKSDKGGKSSKAGLSTVENTKQNQSVKVIEAKLKQLFPEHLVKAEYDKQIKKGKITIFFKSLKEIEDLVESLS
jgi:ParB family chromosome partitioning protein